MTDLKSVSFTALSSHVQAVDIDLLQQSLRVEHLGNYFQQSSSYADSNTFFIKEETE
jgi:hypothetical protein